MPQKATTKTKVYPLFELRSHKPHKSTHMTLPTAAALEDDANWAVERATALPEFWALVAENGDGLLSVAAA